MYTHLCHSFSRLLREHNAWTPGLQALADTEPQAGAGGSLEGHSCALSTKSGSRPGGEGGGSPSLESLLAQTWE